MVLKVGATNVAILPHLRIHPVQQMTECKVCHLKNQIETKTAFVSIPITTQSLNMSSR